MDLRDALQQTLGDQYAVERELGGGGMSRVFLALDQTLGRRIVVTRAAHQAAAFVRELRDRGAVAIELPTIELRDPESFEPLDRAIARIASRINRVAFIGQATLQEAYYFEVIVNY